MQVGGQGFPQGSYFHSHSSPAPEPNPGLYASHMIGQTSLLRQLTQTPAAAQAYTQLQHTYKHTSAELHHRFAQSKILVLYGVPGGKSEVCSLGYMPNCIKYIPPYRFAYTRG